MACGGWYSTPAVQDVPVVDQERSPCSREYYFCQRKLGSDFLHARCCCVSSSVLRLKEELIPTEQFVVQHS